MSLDYVRNRLASANLNHFPFSFHANNRLCFSVVLDMSIEWHPIFSTRAAFRRAKENCYYINQNLISKQFSCARCSPTQPPLGSGECPQCFRSTASAFMVRFRTSPDNPSVMVASSAWTLVLEAVSRNRSARWLHRSPTTRRRCRPPFSPFE